MNAIKRSKRLPGPTGSIRYGVTLCTWLVLILFLGSSAVADTRPGEASPNIIIQIGPPEIIRGPDTSTDNAFNTLMGARSLLGYIANASTWGYIGGSLETLRPMNRVVLQKGDHFDSRGAWLNSVWEDGAVIRGWYHAETERTYSQTRKSVAYAESYDGGLTFVKPNYPHNQVITSPPHYTNPNNDDEGDHRVIQVGDYLYMYFLSNHRPSWQIYLARSHISDHGLPGTWQKYNHGSFSQPGLGGEASPIASWTDLATSWVSYNAYLKAYIGFSGVWDNALGRQKGFGLSVSADGLHWSTIMNPSTSQPYLLLSYEGSWDRQANAGDLVAYPSFVSVYGDSDRVDDVFWLYYMYLNPGDGFDRRYLVRRKLRLSYATSNKPADLVPRMALSEYRHRDDRWFTTISTDPDYQFTKIIGYLFTDQVPNSIPLYDCYIDYWHDHMLVPNDATCGGGDVRYLRRVGWISTVPFDHSTPTYRCWDQSATNHFISTEPSCEGKKTEYLMGYLAIMPPLPQNQFVALSNYDRSDQRDNWATTAKPPREYAFEFRLGYLFTAQQPHSLAVYDCYIDSWRDHMLVVGDPSCGGARKLGFMGYISSRPFPGSLPIYRCFDAQATNHFISLDPRCDGKKLEWLVGYVASRPYRIESIMYLPLVSRE